ncbi:unnamed protein product [marine sediment metagenome]|uniref:Uncharacterized protein n=1 Tax=marine sediment metagenome TaxID=412755 RepID=X0YS26_9ZZZZ
MSKKPKPDKKPKKEKKPKVRKVKGRYRIIAGDRVIERDEFNVYRVNIKRRGGKGKR